MAEQPTIGRIVHYVEDAFPGASETRHFPGIVSEVKGELGRGWAKLTVFNESVRGGVHFPEAAYSEDGQHGTWHWPEREASPQSEIVTTPEPAEAPDQSQPSSENA